MITIFQLVRNETKYQQLGFCIVKDWDTNDLNPYGTFTTVWSIGTPWCAHKSNHKLIYTEI